MGGLAGHIKHPYECMDLTFNDIYQLYDSIQHNKISVYEKLDGINIFVIRIGNEFKFARNLLTLNYPMNYIELSKFFNHIPHVQKVFVEVNNALQSVNSSVFKPNIWYSIEVIHQETTNVIEYNSNYIIVLNEYSVQDGKPIYHKYVSPFIDIKVNNNFIISSIHKLTFEKSGALRQNFNLHIPQAHTHKTLFEYLSKLLTLELKKLGIQYQHDELCLRFLKGDKRLKFTKSNFVNYDLIKNNESQILAIIARLKDPIIKWCHTSTEILKLYMRGHLGVKSNSYEYLLNKDSKYKDLLNYLNGLNHGLHLTTEGFVIEHESEGLIKFTGLFAPINQILGSEKFKR